MHILVLDSSPFFGGAQKSLAETLRWLKKRHQVTLLAGEGMKDCHPDICVPAHHWTASFGGLLQYLADRRRFVQVWEASSPTTSYDIVYANGLRAGMLLAAVKNPPPVLLHDRDIRAPAKLRHWLAGKQHPFVVGTSEEILRMWEGISVRGKEILPPAFDLEALRAVSPVADADVPAVLQVADFVPWKRHSLFCEAVRQKEFRAGICGRSRGDTAYDAEVLGKMREAGVERIASEDALPWIAACKVVVCCSEGEPFGRTVIEALAMGKNVVVTPTACAATLQTLPGVMASEDSPDALAEAIRTALTLPPPNAPLSDYTWGELGPKLEMLLEKL